MNRRQNHTIECSKAMVGRVIGRQGETIKSLQNYTGALIQIDQTGDPCHITISGNPQSLTLAMAMVHDIVRGTFKGFALLRQSVLVSVSGSSSSSAQYSRQQALPRPVYAPGYGLIPPSQLYGGEAAAAGGVLIGGANGYAAGPHLQQAAYPFVQAGQLQQSQLVLQQPQSLQPMSLSSMAVPGAVYNIGGTAYSGPIYYSAQDYATATGGMVESNGHLFYGGDNGAAGNSYMVGGAAGLLGPSAHQAKLLQATNGNRVAAAGMGVGNAAAVRGLVPMMNTDAVLIGPSRGASSPATTAAANNNANSHNGLVGNGLVMNADGQLYSAYNMGNE